MTCDVWRAKLEPYVDCELSEGETAGMEAHLGACAACATDALSRLQMKRRTQAAGARYSPTPEFRLRIEQSIGARSKPLRGFGWVPKLALAVAAVVLVAFASAAMWVQHSTREQTLTQLADLHVATLASTNPVDVVSSDRHTVKPWFQGKLPFTFNLPELEGSPFKLVGGRVTYFQHSPGAQLLFELRKHRMSVFVFREQPGSSKILRGVTATRSLAFNLETWAEGGLRYIVISDASRADVHDLSDRLRRSS